MITVSRIAKSARRAFALKIASIILAGSALGACATTGGGVAMSGAAPRFMATGPSASPPGAFLDFCARSPSDCGLASETAAAAVLSARGDQNGPLRRQLYGQYMWKAVFEAERPALARALETARAVDDSGPTAAIRALSEDGTNATDLAPAMPPPLLDRRVDLDPSYLIRASFSSPSRPEPAAPEPAPLAPAETTPLHLTSELMARLDAVNREVNDRIVQTDDMVTYGVEDYWATPIEDAPSANGRVRGDCEDYALEKRRVLVAGGVPAGALSLAVANTHWGLHVVLLVDTDVGEMVLDSLNARTTSWDKTSYRWIKRQAWGDPLHWISIAQR